MHYRIVPVTRFRQNCSLLWCPGSLRAAVVDPGGDLDLIQAAISDEGVVVEKILVTHGHADHSGGGRRNCPNAWACPSKGPTRTTLF